MNWLRSPPLSLIFAGQETIIGFRVPPKCDATCFVHWNGVSIAMDTPFQWTKQVASHFGGTRNPMIVSWPAKIKDKGGLRSQFMHTIDVVPTIYEVCGITPPDSLNGVPQKPIEGISFAYTFDPAAAG